MFDIIKIEDKEFIKEIEEQGQFLCKGDGGITCIKTDDFYYYYKENVFRIRRTRSYTVEELKEINESMYRAVKNAMRENNRDIDEEELRKSFDREFEPVESAVYESVQESLLSINSEALYGVINCDLFVKNIDMKRVLFEKLSNRVQMDDVQENKVCASLSSTACINKASLYSGVSVRNIEVYERHVEIYGQDRSRIHINLYDENMVIAHEIIDEYRELYRIVAAKDEDNYFDVKVLFIDNERKGPLWGTIIGSK